MAGATASTSTASSSVQPSKSGASNEKPRRSFLHRPSAAVIEETKHFNKREVKKLRSQFKRIAGKNGTLSIEEFRQSLGVVGMIQDSLLCQRLFSVFNKSKTGAINFAEFLEGLGVLVKGSVDEKLDFAFAMCDIDGSGEITYEELLLTVDSIMRIYSGIMGTPNDSATLDTVKVRKMFNKLDRNHDGKINVEEYKRGMRKHPELVQSLRGTNVFQSGQFRVNELLRRRIHKYQKATASLQGKVEQAIAALEQERKSKLEPTPGPAEVALEEKAGQTKAELQRTETLRSIDSDLTITDEEEEESEDYSDVDEGTEEKEARAGPHPQPEKAEQVDALALLRQVQAKLDEMATVDYGSIDYERRKYDLQRSGGSANGKPLMRTSGSSPNDVHHASSDPEHEDRAQRDSDNEALLKKYITPVAKGSTVFFGHKNWDLVLNVMKGIQLTVSRCFAENREVNAIDYAFKEKYTLLAGAKHAVTYNHDIDDIDLDTSGRSCRFIDYAPFVFQNLREHFGIKDEEYVHSIGPGNMLSNLMLGSLSSLSELGSEGKSGSFFYFTSDNKYMVKTVTKEEHKLLRAILPQYHKHMLGGSVKRSDYKPTESMLCRIIGCHVIRLSKHSKIGAKKIYFVVMVNMTYTSLELHRRYDLKGSWVGRCSSEADRKNPKKTLKDKDFIDLQKKLRLGPEKKARLMRTLEKDTLFLEEKGIIDYSLILGIHDHTKAAGIAKSSFASSSMMSLSNSVISDESSRSGSKVSWFHEDCGGIRSIDGKETYVMGILDFLVVYSSRKKAERFGKTMLFLDREGISVMPAHSYRKRFLKFFEDHLE